MMSKARQLFLELYLLRLRYTNSEIDEASDLLKVTNDAELQKIIGALKQIDVGRGRSKTSRQSKPSKNYLGPSTPQNIQKAIVYFAERLTRKRLLQVPDELEKFARSIGVRTYYGTDRPAVVHAIKEALEGMPPTRALQSMRSVDGQSKSDFDAYVSSARTLMRS